MQEAGNNEINSILESIMKIINDYEETFTKLGITKDEANEVIKFFEVLAQIAIENNIIKKIENERQYNYLDKSINQASRR